MTVRLLATGFGGVARPQLQYFSLLDDVEVVAGADVAEAAREWFEEEFDAPAVESHEALLDEFGEEADAISIITPHSFHREQILTSFDAGLDVYVEKPMVIGVEAAVEVVAASREQDRILHVGYQRHFHPLFEDLKELIDEGRIGEPHFASCYLEQDWIEPHRGTWRTDPAISGGGQLYDSGSHLLDALLWTTGAEPKQVAAVMTDDPDRPGVDVDSALAATLDRDGTALTASIGVTADGSTHPETYEELVVVGTEGKVSVEGDGMTVVEQGEEPGETTVEHIELDIDESDVFVAKMDDFVASVKGETEPAVPGEVALPVTALTEAAYAARERGETVDIEALLAAARESVGVAD